MTNYLLILGLSILTEEKFLILVHKKTLDSKINQLDKKLSTFHNIVNKFKVLDPIFFSQDYSIMIEAKILVNTKMI